MTKNKEPSKESLVILESLKKAVANALEKKKRLGQYAVVWGDNGVEIIGDADSGQIKIKGTRVD